MFLLLGQLVYTSFSKVGFQALTSAAIPPEIRQAFVDRIVYQYWDSYNPPSADYRAVYLYRPSADQTLFGWLYNDGVDDLNRSHVPYFVCYYFAGELLSEHLEAIFTCLAVGPTTIVDRHASPGHVDSAVIADHQNYQPARSGVAVPASLQSESRLAVQQGKLFKLLISTDPERVEARPMLEELTSQDALGTGNSTGLIAIADQPESLTFNQPLEPSEIETYQQILLTKIRHTSAPKPDFPKADLSIGKLSLAVAIALLIALISGIYFFRRVPIATIQPAPSTHSTPRLENLSLAKTLSPNSGSVWSVILSPDGKTLISGSADQTIRLWDIDAGTVRNTLVGHTDTIRSLALTPDAKTLISGSGDGTIKLWNLETNQLLQTLQHESSVWTVAVSPDQQTLISGGEDGILKVWELSTGKLRYTIPAHERRIFSATISPDGKTIATASLDRTLKLWDAQTGKLLRTITGHSDAVRALAFSPDGQSLASASWDTTLKLWNWQTGELIRTFAGHRSRAVTVQFSPDGQTLISGSVDNTIKLWSVQSGAVLRTLSDHTDWILSLAIDSTHLVSGSKDETIRIWQR